MSLFICSAICVMLSAEPPLEVHLPAAESFEVGKTFEFVLESKDATLRLPEAPFEFGTLLVLEHRDLAGDSARRAYVAMPTLPGRQETPPLELAPAPGASGPSISTAPFSIDVVSARRVDQPEWVESVDLIEPAADRSLMPWLVALASAAALVWWWRRRPLSRSPATDTVRESLDRLALLLKEDSHDSPLRIETLADGLRRLMSARFACPAEQLTSEELHAVLAPRLRSAADLLDVLTVADDWKYGAVHPAAATSQRVRRAAERVLEELRTERSR